MESFFRIFEFNHMMHDAICGGLTYEGCTILRDLGPLKKGDQYETVYWMISESKFQFVNWFLGDDRTFHPDHTSQELSQEELAPYCHWEATDNKYWVRHQVREPKNIFMDLAARIKSKE